MYYSGYADRICELMAVSRDLSLVDEKSYLQRKASRNCLSEANYIEFDGVKVKSNLLNNLSSLNSCCVCHVLLVMVHPNSGCDPHR